MYGLPYPWRFWFDSALSGVWIADVGQDTIRRNRDPLELEKPAIVLGRSALEGIRCVGERRGQGRGEVVWPAVGHGRNEGCPVAGEAVYRGPRLAILSERYVYGDFCAGTVGSVRSHPNDHVEGLRQERSVKVPLLTHIGAGGELSLAALDGNVHRAGAPRWR